MESKQTGHAGDLSGIKFYQYVSEPERTKAFDVVIIGGSYAGLSAALTLGRSHRRVLIIDSGQPCNSKALHTHNFIAHDGESPAKIIKTAKRQILQYRTVRFVHDKALTIAKHKTLFNINTKLGQEFIAKKILLATGLDDKPIAIPGFAECWGISIIHCPYCAAFELTNMPIGILANGGIAYETARLLSNWTKKITIFTNGVSILPADQAGKLVKHNIVIVENKISRFIHDDGHVKSIILSGNLQYRIHALFIKLPARQSSDIASRQMGCVLTSEGLLQVDSSHKTNVPGVFAAGDNCVPGRAIALAVASGTIAAVSLNKELTDETF